MTNQIVEPDENAPNGGGERTFTQADVDGIVKERLARAGSKKQTAMLEALGVDDVDKAKELIEEARKLKDERLSESERLQKQIDEAKAEAEAAKAEAAKAQDLANERMLQSAVLLETAKAEYGIHESARADIWLHIDKSLIASDETGYTGVEDAIKKAIESRPYLASRPDAPKLLKGTPIKQKRMASSPQNEKPRKSTVKF